MNNPHAALTLNTFKKTGQKKFSEGEIIKVHLHIQAYILIPNTNELIDSLIISSVTVLRLAS